MSLSVASKFLSTPSSRTEEFSPLPIKPSPDTLTFALIGLGIFLAVAFVGCLVLVVFRKRKYRQGTEILELKQRDERVAKPVKSNSMYY